MSFSYNPAHEFGTCSKCGEEMVANVPRLGTRGGFVHKSTGAFMCATEMHERDLFPRGSAVLYAGGDGFKYHGYFENDLHSLTDCDGDSVLAMGGDLKLHATLGRNLETLTGDARGALREAGWSDADVLRVIPLNKTPEQVGAWREAENLILCKLPGFDEVRISAQGARLMVEQLLEVLYGKRAAAGMQSYLRLCGTRSFTIDPEILDRVRELVAHLKDL